MITLICSYKLSRTLLRQSTRISVINSCALSLSCIIYSHDLKCALKIILVSTRMYSHQLIWPYQISRTLTCLINSHTLSSTHMRTYHFFRPAVNFYAYPFTFMHLYQALTLPPICSNQLFRFLLFLTPATELLSWAVIYISSSHRLGSFKSHTLSPDPHVLLNFFAKLCFCLSRA